MSSHHSKDKKRSHGQPVTASAAKSAKSQNPSTDVAFFKKLDATVASIKRNLKTGNSDSELETKIFQLDKERLMVKNFTYKSDIDEYQTLHDKAQELKGPAQKQKEEEMNQLFRNILDKIYGLEIMDEVIQ